MGRMIWEFRLLSVGTRTVRSSQSPSRCRALRSLDSDRRHHAARARHSGRVKAILKRLTRTSRAHGGWCALGSDVVEESCRRPSHRRAERRVPPTARRLNPRMKLTSRGRNTHLVSAAEAVFDIGLKPVRWAPVCRQMGHELLRKSSDSRTAISGVSRSWLSAGVYRPARGRFPNTRERRPPPS